VRNPDAVTLKDVADTLKSAFNSMAHDDRISGISQIILNYQHNVDAGLSVAMGTLLTGKNIGDKIVAEDHLTNTIFIENYSSIHKSASTQVERGFESANCIAATTLATIA